MSKSAIRRHHRQRLIRKWERNNPPSVRELRAVNDKEWREIAKRKYTKTRQPCSCLYCTSPRKHNGNGKASLTFQELRHPIEFD